MQKSTFELENALLTDGYNFVIGIDEAGRGPLAGPVVAGAVALRSDKLKNFDLNYAVLDDKNWDLVRDSKKLSEKQREDIFDFIHENFYVGVGICDHQTVDRINILEASFLAMKSAINDLTRNLAYRQAGVERGTQRDPRYAIHDMRKIILVDGNKKIPNLSLDQKAVIGGDKLVKSISAASIIAKVTRDRIMLLAHEKYPEYGFDKHKGYGTKLHMEMLEKHGPCSIHRQSFAPVKRSHENKA